MVALEFVAALVEMFKRGLQDVSKRGNGGKGPLGSPASPRNRPGEDTLSARIMDTNGMVEGVEANWVDTFKAKG